MPYSFNTTNTTHATSTRNASDVTSPAAANRTNTNSAGWYDPENNFGYGVGRLFRGAFDLAWNAYQSWWNPAPSKAEIALQKQHKIYRQGLEECVKHLARTDIRFVSCRMRRGGSCISRR